MRVCIRRHRLSSALPLAPARPLLLLSGVHPHDRIAQWIGSATININSTSVVVSIPVSPSALPLLQSLLICLITCVCV